MKKNWIVTLAACMVFSLSLSGCGTATNSASQTTSSESSSEAEISGKSEQDLLEEENNILEKNKDLWEKVFSSMDKNITDDMLNANYGDVLIAAIENAKDQFSDKEYEMLMSDAEQIRKIEDEMAALPIDSDNESTNTATGSSFPQFEGNDLDENKVDSSIFAENAVTVVNFWFNDCKPCVEELSEMNALNDRIKEQGGEVIGVNVGTLDGNKENIATAKQNIVTSILILTAMPENLHLVSLHSQQLMLLTETVILLVKHFLVALIMTIILIHSKIQLMKFLQKTLKNKTNLDNLINCSKPSSLMI